MELHKPSYYKHFRCLAGECPDTCCAWWEVPVDGESARRYAALPGDLGEALRAALAADEEGEPCLKLTGGKCPLLTPEGLCALQLRKGEGAIPAVCREHPRFSYDYGAVRELGLCASCPEAARLILAENHRLDPPEIGADPPLSDPDPLLFPLLDARQVAIDLLNAPAPLSARLRAVLLFADALQALLDEEDLTAISGLCREWRAHFPTSKGAQGAFVPETGEALPPRQAVLEKCLAALAGLEHLRGDWHTLVTDRRALSAPPPEETMGARAAAYFLYRHWLRALNDGDVLSWAQFSVLGVAAAAALAPLCGGFAEAFRRFCLEVEHSQENLDALQDFFWDDLSLPEALSLAGAPEEDGPAEG